MPVNFEVSDFWLTVAGTVAGFIDSIAGGGGLITVPLFSLLFGPGALAIGTNKVAATMGSAVAMLIYLRAGHIFLRGNRRFALFAAVGALMGARLSPFIPAEVYKWLIVTVVPLILWIVFNKDLWIKSALKTHTPEPTPLVLWAAGFGCGFYDGIAGPGAGTLMFLSLLVLARLPLITSIATAKVANLATASTSLASFAYTGHVIWPKGLTMAAGVCVGAAVGASLATRWTAPLARAALLVVSVILVIRLVLG